MTQQPKAGPAYTRTAWFARRLDPYGVLGPCERHAAAADLHHRHTAVLDAVGRHTLDLYALADSLTARARDCHAVDLREPIPTAEPLDLDALLGADTPKDDVGPSGPKEPSPIRRAS